MKSRQKISKSSLKITLSIIIISTCLLLSLVNRYYPEKFAEPTEAARTEIVSEDLFQAHADSPNTKGVCAQMQGYETQDGVAHQTQENSQSQGRDSKLNIGKQTQVGDPQLNASSQSHGFGAQIKEVCKTPSLRAQTEAVCKTQSVAAQAGVEQSSALPHASLPAPNSAPKSASSGVSQLPSINNAELVVADYLPLGGNKVQILKNIGYVSAFSNELGVPLWVGYLATYPFKYDTAKRPSSFIKDTRAAGSAEHKDYSNSGYDRGHMAPNYIIGRCYGERAQMETFYLTNIVPQKAEMNRGVWREIEQYIANSLTKKYGKVLVFIGPVFAKSQDKINGKIAVPAACYAVIMAKSKSNEVFAVGFIVPQFPSKKSIWDYCVSVDEIESITGINFFPQLPDDVENKIEASTDLVPFK